MNSPLLQALPESFDFYHMGRIELDAAIPPTTDRLVSDDWTAVAFTVQGEARGVLALFFDSDLDVSTYSEAGNVIASRIATQLDAAISPPRVLERDQIQALLQSDSLEARTYVHRHGNRLIRLTAVLLSHKEIGNA